MKNETASKKLMVAAQAEGRHGEHPSPRPPVAATARGMSREDARGGGGDTYHGACAVVAEAEAAVAGSASPRRQRAAAAAAATDGAAAEAGITYPVFCHLMLRRAAKV